MELSQSMEKDKMVFEEDMEKSQKVMKNRLQLKPHKDDISSSAERESQVGKTTYFGISIKSSFGFW